MDRLIKIIVIAAMALPLVACNNGGSKKGSINTVRQTRGIAAPYGGGPMGPQGVPQPGQPNTFNPGNTQTGQNRLWGAIFAGSLLSMEDFDYNLHDFVANIMSPTDLGYVSGNYTDSTGVRFWGYVEPSSGVLNPNGMSNVTINSTRAELRIVIWDSYAGQVDSSGELITEVPVHIRGGASGSITGNYATIRFTDKLGFIELSGYFDTNYFHGTVWFDNTNGYANYMGEFAVATCAFFRCQ